MQADYCRTCGRPYQDDVTGIEERMRSWCRINSVAIDFADTITTADAERLLDYAPGTLRNQRCRGVGPDYIRRGRHCRYLLSDLAIYFCAERNPA